MRKKIVIILLILGMIILLMALLLRSNVIVLGRSKIKIIDATYQCANSLEKFYEDDKYIYYFPCTKSNSVYVKFSNGNKMLVKEALEDDKVTISELISAGLEVKKQKK